MESNFVTEQLLSGNVTLNLVGICVAVASMAVGITLWAVYRFQSKVDARDAETRMMHSLKVDSDGHKRSIEETRTNFKLAFDGLHDHMTTMKEDQKQEIRQVQQDLSTVRNLVGEINANVGFLRGKAER